MIIELPEGTNAVAVYETLLDQERVCLATAYAALIAIAGDTTGTIEDSILAVEQEIEGLRCIQRNIRFYTNKLELHRNT